MMEIANGREAAIQLKNAPLLTNPWSGRVMHKVATVNGGVCTAQLSG
jgi:hypothetical protein